MPHPHWALPRLLTFLNRARTTEVILEAPELTDDPASGGENGYVIGEKVAQNILTHRSRLPRRRYLSEEDILSVPGLGQDKLNDLLHSFSVSADEAFIAALRAGPIGENWELTPHTINYRNDEAYFLSTAGLDRLALTIADQVAATRRITKNEAAVLCRSAYVATHEEAHIASFPFAQWWYYFDQDNWFSFEQIRLLCENYLGHYQGDKSIKLCMFHSYNASPLNAVWHRELFPVILNPMERKITVWEVQLND